MTVGIFPLLNPYHAVEISGAIVLIYRIRPNVIPGRIKPSHGLSALLRNICQINVPSHTTNTAAMPANKKREKKHDLFHSPNFIQRVVYHNSCHFSTTNHQTISKHQPCSCQREHFSWRAYDKPAQTGAGTRQGRKGNGFAHLPLTKSLTEISDV